MENKLIKGMSHVAYNVTDLDRALDFYCNGLGLEKVFDIMVPENIADIMPDSPLRVLAGKPSIVYLQIAPGAYLELFYPKPDTDLQSGGPNYDRIGYVHLSLIVGDIYEAAEILKGRGIQLDSKISLGPDHTYQVWIKDPDGNRIELMQYTESSYQVVYMKK